MEDSSLIDSEQTLFEALSPDQRLELVLRYAARLRRLAQSMAAAGRIDMVEILRAVADDLDSNANEIAAATLGLDIVTRAAGLIETTEDLVSGGEEPVAVTVH